MIVLICVKEEDGSLVVSHGVNYDTMKNVILPQMHPRDLGASFDRNMLEWVIYED